MAKADWDELFRVSAGFADLNFRSVRLAQGFLPGSETGIKNSGVVSPPGVVLGQKAIGHVLDGLLDRQVGKPAAGQRQCKRQCQRQRTRQRTRQRP